MTNKLQPRVLVIPSRQRRRQACKPASRIRDHQPPRTFPCVVCRWFHVQVSCLRIPKATRLAETQKESALSCPVRDSIATIYRVHPAHWVRPRPRGVCRLTSHETRRLPWSFWKELDFPKTCPGSRTHQTVGHCSRLLGHASRANTSTFLEEGHVVGARWWVI